MDVICERCNTRYEFDEALVSSRGTTVKCTTCGHQFKIYREGGSAEMDGWTVRTVDGRTIHFKVMRQLQSAITQGKVTVDDVLIPHDGAEPRRLGRIEELQTFFQGGDEVTNVLRGSWLPPSKPARTGDTLRPKPPATPDHRTLPRMRRSELLGAMADSRNDRDGNPLPARSGDTKRPPAGSSGSDVSIPAAPQVPRLTSAASRLDDDDAPTGTHTRVPTLPPPGPDGSEHPSEGPPTVPRERRRAREAGTLPSAVAMSDATTLRKERRGTDGYPGLPVPKEVREHHRMRAATPAPQDEMEDEATVARSELSEGAAALKRSGSAQARSTPPRDALPSEHPVDAPGSDPVSSTPTSSTPSVQRPSVLRQPDDGLPRHSDYPVSRQRAGWLRWGVGLLVLGMLGVGGFALMQKLSQDSGTTATTAAAGNERVNKFLEQGQERLAEGDLEGAKEQYNKASGIDENEPRVASALARVELIRADLAWLHLRLLASDAPQRNTVALQLRRATERADKALKALPKSAADDPNTVGLRMDLLRMQGKPAEARKLAAKLPSGGADAGRVLAVLDLSEADPTFASIFDRLRTAARSERKLGRAQAALVYALALAGEKDEAEQELSNLRALNEHHELMAALTAFVKQAEQKKDTPKDASSAAPASSAGPSDGIPRDFREALRRAHAARARGDLDSAERLYRAALDADPGNTEAMAGLADVARDRGDSGSAAKRYEDMLKDNPSYIPGLIGLADVKWASGDKAGAVKLYQEVAQAAPGSSYADQANARINQYAKEQASKPEPQPQPTTTAPEPQPSAAPTATETSPPPPPPPPPAPDPPPPSGVPDGVDTSDLPDL